MIKQEKINAVREYLKSEFNGFQIDDAYDDERLSQKFRVSDDAMIYIVKFDKIFLDKTPDIKTVLRHFELSKFMRVNNTKQILVTERGLEVL